MLLYHSVERELSFSKKKKKERERERELPELTNEIEPMQNMWWHILPKVKHYTRI